MSRLRELHQVYSAQGTSIPVEQYDGTGKLVQGVIMRFGQDDNEKVLVMPFGGRVWVEAVILPRQSATPEASPVVWFLAPIARMAYANLINPEFSRYALLREQLCQMQFKALSETCPTVQCHHIVEWPGLNLMKYHGFISVNKPDEPICGFLYHDGKDPMCMEFMSRIPDTAVLSKMGQ